MFGAMSGHGPIVDVMLKAGRWCLAAPFQGFEQA